mgnify:CR=1 FL=1
MIAERELDKQQKGWKFDPHLHNLIELILSTGKQWKQGNKAMELNIVNLTSYKHYCIFYLQKYFL